MFASFGYLFGLFYVKQNWDFSTCSCSNWHVLYFLWATISIFGICYSFIHFSFSKVFYNKWMNYALCMVLAGLCSSSILIYPGYFCKFCTTCRSFCWVVPVYSSCRFIPLQSRYIQRLGALKFLGTNCCIEIHCSHQLP